MKSILFIRHAKSDWDSGVSTDFDRPLNQRGLRDAPAMGQRLKNSNFMPDLILLSSSVRTNQTIDLITKNASWEKANQIEMSALYHGSATNYMTIIGNLTIGLNNVVICAHNPTITVIIPNLSGEKVGNIPTCGMAKIDFEVQEWTEISNNSGNLDFLDYPKNI